MALVFDQTQVFSVPVFNQSPWVVTETDQSGTLSEWRMLVEVRAGNTNNPPPPVVGTFIMRFRMPQGQIYKRVVFDPSETLQALVSHDFSPVSSTGPWEIAPNTSVVYTIRFTSQKLVNGVWESKSAIATPYRRVWNAALDPYDFVDYDETDFVNSVNQMPKPLTSFLPSLTDIGSDQSYWLQFLSDTALAPALSTIIRYPLPDLQGPSLAIDPIWINQFGFDLYAPGIGNSYTRRSVRLGVGPRDLANISSPIDFSNTASYLVRVVTSSFQLQISFNIRDCWKYTPTRLHWLNKLGGFDSWTFGMKSHTEEKVDRKQFYKQKNTLVDGHYGYEKMSRGTNDYHIGLEEEMTLNSDLLSDVELEHLRQLVSSPVVFMETGSNGYMSVNVVDRSWMQKRGKQDGTFNLEIKIKPSIDGMRQRG